MNILRRRNTQPNRGSAFGSIRTQVDQETILGIATAINAIQQAPHASEGTGCVLAAFSDTGTENDCTCWKKPALDILNRLLEDKQAQP